MSPEMINPYEAPHIKFPDNPKLIRFDTYAYPVYKYIPKSKFVPQLKIYCKSLNLEPYDAIFMNLKGGRIPAGLVKIFSKFEGKIIPIEYHRDGRIVTQIPEEFRDKNCGIVDDVFDSGTTIAMMREHCPTLDMFVMSYKLNVPNQLPAKNIYPVFYTDDVWQGGVGMNLEKDEDEFYPANAFRNYLGIVVRPPDKILEVFNKY